MPLRHLRASKTVMSLGGISGGVVYKRQSMVRYTGIKPAYYSLEQEIPTDQLVVVVGQESYGDAGSLR